MPMDRSRSLAERALVPFALVALGVLCAPPALADSAAGADAFTAALGKGPVYAALAAFAGGLLVSLTPCVYPMVAVTVSVFGGRQVRSRWQGVALSAAFVAGIVAMFTPLGVLAGLTGSVFGSVLQSPWVLVGIAILFLVLAASLFGAFELGLPPALTNRLAELGGLGFRGAFVLGLVCGLIAAPCTGPVLTGILTWIAKTQSAGLGAAAMSAFSLGLGVPFFLVGAFALQLPKSGAWMVHVKSLLGIVLVVVALYFLATAFPGLVAFVRPAPWFLAVAAAAALVGVFFGAVHRDFAEAGWGNRIAKSVGIVLTCAGAFLLLAGFNKPKATLSWLYVPWEDARAQALAESRPMLIDFTAAWCVACKELDKHTFAEPVVAQEASRFVAVKVDATDDEDPAVEAAMREFRVVGLPTVLLFDSEGREAARFTDFVAAGPFLEVLRRVD
jgi:thiol:disulfide interchange protein DsbD